MGEKKGDDAMRRELGISRRDLLKRGAVVGGTLIWAAPAIQSLAPAAQANHVRGHSPGTCAACYCYNGNINDPPPGPGQPQQDECSDNGPVGHRFNGDQCDKWCKHDPPFNTGNGAPGGPYEHSVYCSGDTFCDCNTRSDPGPNGVACP